MRRLALLLIFAASCQCDETHELRIEPNPTPPPTEVTPEVDVAEVSIKAISGDVERRAGEMWRPAQVGDTLNADDSVRTGSDGRLTLSVGEGAVVDLEAASEVKVAEVSLAVAKLELERGRLGASVKSEKMKVRVAARGSDVVAEATEGEFSVFNNGRGLVAVVAKSSGVTLETASGRKALDKGQQADVQGDQVKIAEVSKSVYLKVAWPERRLTRAKTTKVRGHVAVGSLVAVNGSPATVGEDGSFEVEVPLDEGSNALTVVAKDLAGREKQDAIAVLARRKAPRVKAKTEELWK